MKLIRLSKKEYKGFEISIAYKSKFFYKIEKEYDGENLLIKFIKKPFGHEFYKDNHTNLFKDHWIKPRVYAIREENKLVAFIEISYENWNKRLRVTNISVNENYKRKGFATILMNKAKEIAKKNAFRAIILETQTSNYNAIKFYEAQGFHLGGFNECDYSNQDIENNEVRIEMVYYLK